MAMVSSSGGLFAAVSSRASSGMRHLPLPRELLEQPLRHHLPVYLVGAIVDAGGAGLAVEPFERRVFGEAERPMHLDGTVNHALERVGAVELDQRDLRARLIPLVHPPGGVQREQARGLD